MAGQPWIMVALGIGLVAFCITLVVLLFTRWGHQPLRKCLLLSLLAHGLFAGYATTVQIFSFTPRPREEIVKISLVDGTMDADAAHTAPAVVDGKTTAGQAMMTEAATEKVKPAEAAKTMPDKPRGDLKAVKDPTPEVVKPIAAVQKAVVKESAIVKTPVLPQTPAAPAAVAKAAETKSTPVKADLAKLQAPVAAASAWEAAPVAPKYGERVPDPPSVNDAVSPVNVLRTPDPVQSVPAKIDTTVQPPPLPMPPEPVDTVPPTIASSTPAPQGTAASSNAPPLAAPLAVAVPNTYRLRLAADHLPAAVAAGGSVETEAAVKAALKWFAENQMADGRWSARQHGAGRDATPDGIQRANAGIDADTGMTGLALLTLLASGHTHRQGQYQEVVRRGCNFLISQQNARGSLAGSADRFAAMYSHAIATFALSEDYGMTRDPQLEPPVRLAIGYTVAAQDAFGGGWRYQPGDAGDTSQLGWQFMALKSADLAGVQFSPQTRQGITRYLNSVASGQHGGLASYRAGQAPSRTMTAEALACWQFLGLAQDHPAASEAANYVLEVLPGNGQPNYYYWYYGTLATFQMRGEPWRKWNAAVATQLVRLQKKDGTATGTWDPDAVWGGYGGRIYSTALATLCLEVYYRYLPVYAH
jgi:hypothetical protein